MKPITKEILEKLYYDVLSERNGLNEVDYQKEWLTNPETYSHNNNVLAQAPASGKTNTILIYLEICYRLGLLEKPTLIFPAAETLLKMNMEKSLIEFKPSFTFMVINTKDDIVKAKNDNINVIISLPHMFTERNINNVKLLPKSIGLLITDEAHIWFLKKTIKNFIKTKKITKFVELTGSPYLFNLRNQIAKQNGKNEPYRMFYVTTNDLLDRGRISNVKLKMITTPAYNFTHKSFIGNYGNLKQGLTNSKKKNRHLLKDVLNELLKKCNYNCEIPYIQNKNNIGIISRAWHGVANMIDNFGQTMICCDSQAMADEFYKTFIENDSIKDKVLLSHSKNDPKSENFELFEKNPNQYKILIVVDRGQLGYNYLELFNIIDFTFSTNLTTIHQRLNRVTRKSVLNPDKDKIFFKVSTNELEGYYKIIMSAVLCLNERNWYENYNTKNLGQLPLTLIKKRKRNGKSNPTKQKKNNKVRLQNFDDLEILDFQSFNGVLHNPDGAFEVYSQITLDDARREFFNITGKNQFSKKRPFLEAREFIRKLKLSSYEEFIKYCNGELKHLPSKPDDIPVAVWSVYKKDGWVSMPDFLGYDVTEARGKDTKLKDVIKYFKDNKITSQKMWKQFCTDGKRASNIPANPILFFKKRGIDAKWSELTGNSAPQDSKYRPFINARKYIRSLMMKKVSDYRIWASSDKRPSDIPTNPHTIRQYRKHWKDYYDFLGIK